MLGKTAGGLYWMFRYLERAENIARLIEAGFRIALTRSSDAEAEWKSVIVTSAVQGTYEAVHDGYDSSRVINFLLREPQNPSSVLSVIKAARDNARLTRTALTTEVWYAVNDTWMMFSDLLKEPVPETEVPGVLAVIRQQAALVRGALHGTMLRNDIYDFCSLGIAVERMDNTARIIDVKYYSLLPSPSFVGSRMDNVQWETVLRSVSAHRSFRWAVEDDFTAPAIANFLILDPRMPRSLHFCASQIAANLSLLSEEYRSTKPSNDMAEQMLARLKGRDIGAIFEEGLHQFVNGLIVDTGRLAQQIEQDYRFTG
ncbi:A alpha-helical domain with a conserved ER moti [Sulfitobacter alexandrii]|uniref:A alpha-helical domain with a conserved ER moti n=1 Tax=Sulfitobacter alexandrii TaxID=1917485 RepID=A0A1J0WGU0_9RHOB|nr:alpha-E domain-containing protein [Sulfitobacter alexandrii]APE43523.1 A alpha-helical domain with a conserved ER moti [Sulfitobacter alexandrii]